MSVELQREDFRRLATLVQDLPEFTNVRDRRRLVAGALEGEPRAATILAGLDLDGNPRSVAGEVITTLSQFGQVAGGKEALGVFLNELLDRIGEGGDRDFIGTLFANYALDKPVERTTQAGRPCMPDTLKVFVSYSHQDGEYLKDDSLLGFLKGLEKEAVEFWTDRKIRPGELWDEVIKTNLQDAQIALVLVSQGFLDSEYCQNVEIERFLATKAHLFPIILSPCEWQRHEWLKRRQFVPGGNETIEEHYTDAGKRKRLFLDIREALRVQVEQVRRVRKELAAASLSLPSPGTPVRPVTAATYSGKTKLAFCKRLGDDWRMLADYLEIPPHDQGRFEKGDEARSIWVWLENRRRLDLLPEALRYIDRGDLTELLHEGN